MEDKELYKTEQSRIEESTKKNRWTEYPLNTSEVELIGTMPATSHRMEMRDASVTTALNTATTRSSTIALGIHNGSSTSGNTAYVPYNYGIRTQGVGSVTHATMNTSIYDNDKRQRDAILRYLMEKGVDKVTPEMAAVLGMKTISINTHLTGGPIKKVKKHKKLEFKI